MKHHIKRVAVLSLGSLFVLLGIMGLFIPILPGIIFLFIGLLLFSKESKIARAILEKLKAKFPRLYTQSMRYTKKARVIMMVWIKKMTWTKNRSKSP